MADSLARLAGLGVSSGLSKEPAVSGEASVQVASITLPADRFHVDPFPPLARAGRSRVYPYPMQDDLTDEEQQPANASSAEFRTRAAELLRSLAGDSL